jgi:hypothetical protein
MFKKLNHQPFLKGSILSFIFYFGTNIILFLVIQLLLYLLSFLFGLMKSGNEISLKFILWPQVWVYGTSILLLFNLIQLLDKKQKNAPKTGPFILGQILIAVAMFFVYQAWQVNWENPSDWFQLTVGNEMVN